MQTAETEMPRGEPRLHLRFIDGIRALAALYVVLGHIYFEPTNGYYTSRLLTHLGLAYGHLAVDVFIVVSGFCLMLPVARHGGQIGSLREFFRRRARRILPPYYAALLISMLFIATFAHATDTGTIWDACPPLTTGTVLRHLLLVHDFAPFFEWASAGVAHGQINYPLWSIAVEVQVYLFMPLIVVSLRRWGNGATLAWTALFGLILERMYGARVELACPWYLGLFCAGAIAAREGVRAQSEAGKGMRWIAYTLAVLAVAVPLAAGNHRFREHPMPFDDLAGIATALMLYVLFTDAGRQRQGLSRALAWPPLTRLGLFSYSLYLVHAPVLHACYLALHPLLHVGAVGMFAALLCCLPLIVAAAYGFHLLFERPFLPVRH